jgi:hypothetical protein
MEKQEREPIQEAHLTRLRQQIQIGLDQADRGELLDGETVFEELERRKPAR